MSKRISMLLAGSSTGKPKSAGASPSASIPSHSMLKHSSQGKVGGGDGSSRSEKSKSNTSRNRSTKPNSANVENQRVHKRGAHDDDDDDNVDIDKEDTLQDDSDGENNNVDEDLIAKITAQQIRRVGRPRRVHNDADDVDDMAGDNDDEDNVDDENDDENDEEEVVERQGKGKRYTQNAKKAIRKKRKSHRELALPEIQIRGVANGRANQSGSVSAMSISEHILSRPTTALFRALFPESDEISSPSQSPFPSPSSGRAPANGAFWHDQPENQQENRIQNEQESQREQQPKRETTTDALVSQMIEAVAVNGEERDGHSTLTSPTRAWGSESEQISPNFDFGRNNNNNCNLGCSGSPRSLSALLPPWSRNRTSWTASPSQHFDRRNCPENHGNNDESSFLNEEDVIHGTSDAADFDSASNCNKVRPHTAAADHSNKTQSNLIASNIHFSPKPERAGTAGAVPSIKRKADMNSMIRSSPPTQPSHSARLPYHNHNHKATDLALLSARANELVSRDWQLLASAPSSSSSSSSSSSQMGLECWSVELQQQNLVANSAQQESLLLNSARNFQKVFDNIKKVLDDRTSALETYVGQDIKCGRESFCDIEARKYSFFRYKLPVSLASHCLKLDFTAGPGKAEVYISTKEMYCYGRKTEYQWIVSALAGHKSLVIGPRDNGFRPGMFFVSVFAHDTTRVMIRVSHVVDHRASSAAASAGGGGTATALDSDQSTKLPSRREILDRLELKFKALKQNPDRLAQFQQRLEAIESEMAAKSGLVGQRNSVVQRNLDVSRNKPERAAARQEFQKKLLQQRLQEAAETRHEQESLRKKMVVERIAERAERRQKNIEARMLQQRNEALQQLQIKWLVWIAVISRQQHFISRMQKVVKVRQKNKRLIEAAVVIQRCARRFLRRLRLRRATQYIQSLRTCVRVCLVNYQLVKQHRSADVLKMFLEQITGVNSISRIVKNFRRRIISIQRMIRTRLSLRKARMVTWSLQWDAMVNEMIGKGQLSPHTTILAKVKKKSLQDHMLALQLTLRMQVEQYRRDHLEYQQKLKLEAARRMVMNNKKLNCSTLNEPIRPHPPAVLPQVTLVSMIKEAVRTSEEVIQHQSTLEQGVKRLETTHHNKRRIGPISK